jgi:hypothetical protein
VKCHKHRTFLVLQYACGLRLNEAAHLKISDIDSQRMQIRVDCGKGQKTRMVPMAPRLLAALREYWIAYRPEVYLFPGKSPDTPLQPTTIQKMFKVAAKDAGILKHVTPHTLRHSYATGLLEAGVDLLAISRLLGHASFSTTMVYLHVRTLHLGSAPSPIDWLPVNQLPGWMQPPGNNGALNRKEVLRTLWIRPEGLAHPLPGPRGPGLRSIRSKGPEGRHILQAENAYEYTSATSVSYCLQHKESPALVDRWISRRGFRVYGRYYNEPGRIRNSSRWIL